MSKKIDYKKLVLTDFPVVSESLCSVKIMDAYKLLKRKPKLAVFINEWYERLYDGLVLKFGKPGGKSVASVQTTFIPAAQAGTHWKRRSCSHLGTEPVSVGGTACLYLTGTRHMRADDPPPEVDYIVALDKSLLRNTVGKWYTILNVDMPDMGEINQTATTAVPVIADLLKKGKKVLMYCIGSHGRTGSMLAMLIAYMEPDVLDPVAAARERHCEEAVESRKQIEGIFKFAGKPVPEKYEEEFKSFHFQGLPGQQGHYQQPLWNGHGDFSDF